MRKSRIILETRQSLPILLPALTPAAAPPSSAALLCGGGAALTKGRLFVIATKEKN